MQLATKETKWSRSRRCTRLSVTAHAHDTSVRTLYSLSVGKLQLRFGTMPKSRLHDIQSHVPICPDSAHNAAGDARRASTSTISSAGREHFTGRHSRCAFTPRRPYAPRPSIVPPLLALTATSCIASDPSPFVQCWCRAIAGRQRRAVCVACVPDQHVKLLFGRCPVMVPDGSVHGPWRWTAGFVTS
jgi:hypothetical protein